MITYKTETTKVQTPSKITCNMCAVSYDANDYEKTSSFTTHQTNFGFGSTRDGDVHLSHICEKCQDIIVSRFKIPPQETRRFHEDEEENCEAYAYDKQ